MKNDLISEAELLIYQMRVAQLNLNYDSINLKACSLTRVCKKLELIKEEEDRLKKEFGV